MQMVKVAAPPVVTEEDEAEAASLEAAKSPTKYTKEDNMFG